jgi:oxalate decarboxylase
MRGENSHDAMIWAYTWLREDRLKLISRRNVVAATSAVAAAAAGAAQAATFGNPDLPPQGAGNVTNPDTLKIPGPNDATLADEMPAFLSPPATDVGSMPQFWASFNLAARRVQDGG